MSVTWKGIVGKGFTPDQFTVYIKTLGTRPSWVQFIVLHNTAEPTLANWHHVTGQQRMSGLQEYYRDEQHWSGGPHLFVADDLIWVFTPLNVPGVHSPSWNNRAWGVEMVGDYDSEVFDSGTGSKVRDNAVHAIAVLSHWAHIDSSTMKLHKEDPNTTHDCPGKHVSKSDFIQRVHNHILTL